MSNYKYLTERLSKAESIRNHYESMWRDISHYVAPNRGNFVSKTGTQYANTTKSVPNIYNSTAVHANTILASTLYSGLINPSTKWFRLEIKDKKTIAEDNINRFLEKAADIILRVFNSADTSFSQQAHEVFLDLTAYGTGCMYLEEDDELGFRFSSRHLNEIFIMEDYKGMVDTVFRKFSLTARQIVQQFGDEALAISRISKCIDKNPDEELELIHVVMPNDIKNKDNIKYKFNYKSCYFLEDFSVLLNEGYFYEMPYLVPRWSKRVGDVYGRSPAWNTLPDIKTVNSMEETLLKAAHKRSNPPLLIADDGVLQPIRTYAGALIYGGLDSTTMQPRIRQMDMVGDLGINDAVIEKKNKVIRDGFFIDQLVFREGPQMTATEVMQRQEENLRLLGPQVTRIQNEFLNQLINRMFLSLIRRGFISEIPAELKGKDIDISYQSPLQKLQEMESVNALTRTIQTVIPFIQADPSLMGVFKGDEAVRHVATAMGVPLTLLRSEEEVAKIRQAQEQAQAMQQQMAMLQQGAAAGKDLGAMMGDLNK